MGQQMGRQTVVERGRVARWAAKGWGFITPASGDSDVFVNYSGVEGTGFRNLNPGAEVTFVREHDDQGRERAERVQVVEVQGNR